jgi:hypothetical protein
MKKLLLCMGLLPLMAASQNFHFSARLGAAGYNGDLKANFNPFSQSSLMGSFGGQYDLTEHITARTYFTLTKLKGDDKKGTDAMQERNLNFQSKLFEWELSAQYSFFSLNNRWWTPYVFAGVGIYNFNPYTENANGDKVYLRPLSTEGQGFAPGIKEYKRTQLSLPFGFGANYSLGEDSRVGIEFGYRKTFTDHIDDVSGFYVDEAALFAARGQQAVDMAYRGGEKTGNPYPVAGSERGNPDSKDGYYYVTVTFTLRYWFDKYKQIVGLPGGSRDKKVGCPATRSF